MATPTRVLVANVAEMDEKVRECLPGHELHFVRAMFDAVHALRQDGFQLIVIGLEFDESRMLELLQYVRTLPAYREVPVVCVHAGPLNLGEAAIRNIEVAVKALGGMASLDLGDGALDARKGRSFLDRVAVESGSSATQS